MSFSFSQQIAREPEAAETLEAWPTPSITAVGSDVLPVSFEVTYSSEEQYLHAARTVAEELDPHFLAVCAALPDAPTMSGRYIQQTAGLIDREKITPIISWQGFSEEDLSGIMRAYALAGVSRLLIRPDGKHMMGQLEYGNPVLGMKKRVVDLVKLARDTRFFDSIGLIVRQEKSPERSSVQAEYRRMEQILPEVDYAVTQVMLTAAPYRGLMRAMRASGIETPVIPGIGPFRDASEVLDISALYALKAPKSLKDHENDSRPQLTQMRTERLMADLGRSLLAQGAPGLHIYTNNNMAATKRLLRSIKEN